MRKFQTQNVFGLVRELPLNYVERKEVDQRLKDCLKEEKHITIFGSSKQGKTCLRKHCLKDEEYILVQCNNKWSLADLNSNILKRAGYEVEGSKKVSISGKVKCTVTFKPHILPLHGEGNIETDSDETKVYQPLDLDMEDANDIIAALGKINFCKHIVLEDFHYLKQEVQKDFSFELKTFHEISRLCFIVVGVWLDENRLTTYNGDLTGRIVSVNADNWSGDKLREVINKGADLLNISFDSCYIDELIDASLGNVYIVQEACCRVCKSLGINETQDKHVTIHSTKINVKQIVNTIISEQSGRYNAFISNYSSGFQSTQLEMHKWLLYPLLTASIEQLETGLTYRYIRELLQKVHPRKKGLNAGNVTQALQAVASLQVEKSIQPIVLDYDGTNQKLHVVDRGFIIWLSTQSSESLLSLANISGIEEL